MKVFYGFIVGCGIGLALIAVLALLFGPVVLIGNLFGNTWALVLLCSEFIILMGVLVGLFSYEK